MNGRYEGGGKGELYVSYEGDHRVLRYVVDDDNALGWGASLDSWKGSARRGARI